MTGNLSGDRHPLNRLSRAAGRLVILLAALFAAGGVALGLHQGRWDTGALSIAIALAVAMMLGCSLLALGTPPRVGDQAL